MKRLFSILSALAILLFAGCSKESNYPSLIQGSWRAQSVKTEILKGGMAVDISTIVKDMAAQMDLSEGDKTLITSLLGSISGEQDLSGEGPIILTFKDGKATGVFRGVAEEEPVDYSITGKAIIFSENTGEGVQRYTFTIETLTRNSLTLSFDPIASGQYQQEAAKGFAAMGYSLLYRMDFIRQK